MLSLVRCMQCSPIVHISFLQAVLGEKHSATLGVAAGGRDLRMQTVLKAVKEAPHQRISVSHIQIHHVFQLDMKGLKHDYRDSYQTSYFVKFVNALDLKCTLFFSGTSMFLGSNSWGRRLSKSAPMAKHWLMVKAHGGRSGLGSI